MQVLTNEKIALKTPLVRKKWSARHRDGQSEPGYLGNARMSSSWRHLACIQDKMRPVWVAARILSMLVRVYVSACIRTCVCVCVCVCVCARRLNSLLKFMDAFTLHVSALYYSYSL